MLILRNFKECLEILSSSDRRKYWTVVVIQGFLGFLDFLGIAVLGVIGVVAIRGVQSQPASGTSLNFLKLLNLSSLNLQKQVAILGLFAAIILITRTILTMYFNWKILRFLARRSAEISSNLLTRMVFRGQTEFYKKNISEIQYILGPGVSSIAVGILGSASTIIADLASILIVSTGVVLIDPTVAILSAVLFSSVGVFFYFILRVRVETYGLQLAKDSIDSNQKLSELISGFRQIFASNRVGFYTKEIIDKKTRISKLTALNTFVPSIGKYAIEVSIVIGGTLISAGLFLFSDSTHAFSGLAIFITAGTRIAPALLRLQQGALSIKSHMTLSALTLSTIRDLKDDSVLDLSLNETDFLHGNFNPEIKIQGIKFYYGTNLTPNLEIDNLVIEAGSSVAIVGPSGAGKTTLIDVVLGILKPAQGKVYISGLEPNEVISKWPGAISYVPQDIIIVQGSIAENIALGYKKSSVSNTRMNYSIKISQLAEFIDSLPEGVNTQIGERGVNLSGGQRQRLGIARAMYSSPKLLILDEATSALDGITEDEFTKAISKTNLDITRITIAHRLATVVNSDQVIYLEDGKILAFGSFNEVRSKVPNFDKSARLMGI